MAFPKGSKPPKQRHHRLCKSRGGSGNVRSKNISRVSEKKHQAYHLLFGNGTPNDVARILTKTWIDPDYRLIAVREDFPMTPYAIDPKTYAALVDLDGEHSCSLSDCSTQVITREGFIMWSDNDDGDRCYHVFCSIDHLLKAIPCYSHTI